MTSPRPSWLAHRRWPTFSEIKVFRWSISTSSKRKIHLCPHLPSLLSFLGGRSDYRLGFQGQLFHWCPGSVPYLPSGVRVCVCIICYFSHIIFKSWYVVFSSLFNSTSLCGGLFQAVLLWNKPVQHLMTESNKDLIISHNSVSRQDDCTRFIWKVH